MADKIRVGVIGSNFGALVHIPAFKYMPDTEVVAVCSARQERAEQTAKQFGIPHNFTDYHKMLEMKDLDAVSIVSPGYLHYEMTKAALNAGKHVLCEKAFTATLNEAQELESLAKQKGLTGMIAHEFRFTPPRGYLKELVQGGYLGKVRNINVNLFLSMSRPGAPAMTSGQPRPWSWADEGHKGGGMLFSLGSHFIDGLRDIVGDVVRASGKLYNTSPERIDSSGKIRMSETDDSFNFNLQFANGAWCSMSASFAVGFGRNAGIEIYGSEGALFSPQTGPNPSPVGKVFGAKKGDSELKELLIPEHLKPPSAGGDERAYSMALLVSEFVRGIREHKSPSPSFTDGLRCVEVLDAIQRSNKEGRWVKIA
jgi:predicted dehydrogenase